MANSSSSRAFSRQLDGALGERFRLVAVDLPGHGASDDATDPGLYSLPGHARAVGAVVEALGLGDAFFVGWSLGGHLVLEMAPDLPKARGFLIFGAPPLASSGPRDKAFLPNPAIRFAFQESIDNSEASVYLSAFFRPGFADLPPFFLADILRTDGRARSGFAANHGYRDEVAIVRELKAPLAVLHGADEQVVDGRYFATVPMPTLWRGAVQTIPRAGHTPQWETPAAFDGLLEAFIAETA